MKFNKKLQLNKETIARLNNEEQSSVNGGQVGTITCTPNSEICGIGSYDCPIVCPVPTDDTCLAGSRFVCNTKKDSDCANSKSCKPGDILCIPF